MNEKIITPTGEVETEEQNTAEAEAATARLTTQAVNALAGAVAQLVDLESRSIKQPNDDRLRTELRRFISGVFLKHSQEFIGCWFTVRLEYEPLCQVIAHILGHADVIRQQSYRQQRVMERQISEAAAKLKAEQEKKV